MLGMPSYMPSMNYGYMQPSFNFPMQSYGGYPMPMSPGYGGSPYQGVDPSSGYMFSMCMGMMSQLMDSIFGLIHSGPNTGTGCRAKQGVGCDKGNSQAEELESPESNSEVLELLSEYADEIPARNGRIDKDALEKFAKGNANVPDAVKEAAAKLAEDEDLYNLLCLQSGDDPKKGFDKDLLEDREWEDLSVDIDDLDSFDSDREGGEEAVSTLNEHINDIKGLNKDSSDTGDLITFKDLEAIALGQAGPALDEPELQAAALRILGDKRLRNRLDAFGATGNGVNDGKIASNAFAQWLNQ